MTHLLSPGQLVLSLFDAVTLRGGDERRTQVELRQKVGQLFQPAKLTMVPLLFLSPRNGSPGTTAVLAVQVPAHGRHEVNTMVAFIL